jgi:hypothetical protein
MSKTQCFSSVARTTSTLHFAEQGCDFKPKVMEIGMLSNVYFEKENTEPLCSQTVSVTSDRRSLKIGSKAPLTGTVFQTKHYRFLEATMVPHAAFHVPLVAPSLVEAVLL